MERFACLLPFRQFGRLRHLRELISCGAAIVCPLVDSYATPDGVTAILDDIPPHGEPGERPPSRKRKLRRNESNRSRIQPLHRAENAEEAAANHRRIPQFRYLRRHFYQHGAGDARYSAIFHLDGLINWKLVAVDLNG